MVLISSSPPLQFHLPPSRTRPVGCLPRDGDQRRARGAVSLAGWGPATTRRRSWAAQLCAARWGRSLRGRRSARPDPGPGACTSLLRGAPTCSPSVSAPTSARSLRSPPGLAGARGRSGRGAGKRGAPGPDYGPGAVQGAPTCSPSLRRERARSLTQEAHGCDSWVHLGVAWNAGRVYATPRRLGWRAPPRR